MTIPATQLRSPAALREAIRAGQFTGPTAGQVPGFVQANLVVVPESAAADFSEFCRLNSQACPLLAQTAPGNPEPAEVAPGADLRTDVPRYRVFHSGQCADDEPTDVRHLWRDDLVAFLLGCSFTFERALQEAGLHVRHIDQQCNVPMYRTNVDCHPAGDFAGPLVVSMRPYLPEQVPQVMAVTRRFPGMHGAPVHAGNPAELGIADIARPDFGDPALIGPGEVPVFWACGVTPQLALAAAKLDLAITHSPGCMFVTDLTDDQFEIEI